jgi:hypothetical protein
MLLKILIVARALSALAETEAFQALIAALQEIFKDREPLFGAVVDGNTELQELKQLCKNNGVDEVACDDLCGRLAAA